MLHCRCGAKREAPKSLTIVSCVQCGRAMSPTSPTQIVAAPPRQLVSVATLSSQIVGALGFALSVYWIGARQTITVSTVSLLLCGALSVFAGGQAHRGSTNALLVCTFMDTAVAIILVAHIPPAVELANPVVTRLALPIDALATVGSFSALAAIACVLSIPQARRFAAWRTARILHTAKTSRGGA